MVYFNNDNINFEQMHRTYKLIYPFRTVVNSSAHCDAITDNALISRKKHDYTLSLNAADTFKNTKNFINPHRQNIITMFKKYHKLSKSTHPIKEWA